MLELDDLPLIDQHVHIFERESDQPTFDPLATFSLGGDWVDFLDSGGHKPTDQERNQLQVNQRQAMIYHEAMHAVAGYLGCEPNREAIIAARAKKAADYKSYVRGMYRDINLESNIVDLGHPKNVSLAEFEALTGVPAFGLLRIEPVIGEIWDQQDSLAGLEKAFEERIRKAASDPKIISLKTVIAYRTGLELKPLASSVVSTAMDNLKQGPHAAGLFAKIHVPRSTRDDVKRVRDHLVWRALELSIRLLTTSPARAGRKLLAKYPTAVARNASATPTSPAARRRIRQRQARMNRAIDDRHATTSSTPGRARRMTRHTSVHAIPRTDT